MFEHIPYETLLRDVEGLLIPAGTPIVLPAGLTVRVTQSLGTSLTLYVNGNLVRVYARDADALGREPQELQSFNHQGPLTEQHVMQALKDIYDPEIPVNIVDLGLIYNCEITSSDKGDFVKITMTLTSAGCGMGPILAQDVETCCLSFPSVYDAHIDVVFDPPWNQQMMSEAARLELGFF
jgi:probable FeS assembly SUF system protein SufT